MNGDAVVFAAPTLSIMDIDSLTLSSLEVDEAPPNGLLDLTKPLAVSGTLTIGKTGPGLLDMVGNTLTVADVTIGPASDLEIRQGTLDVSGTLSGPSGSVTANEGLGIVRLRNGANVVQPVFAFPEDFIIVGGVTTAVTLGSFHTLTIAMDAPSVTVTPSFTAGPENPQGPISIVTGILRPAGVGNIDAPVEIGPQGQLGCISGGTITFADAVTVQGDLDLGLCAAYFPPRSDAIVMAAGGALHAHGSLRGSGLGKPFGLQRARGDSIDVAGALVRDSAASAITIAEDATDGGNNSNWFFGFTVSRLGAVRPLSIADHAVLDLGPTQLVPHFTEALAAPGSPTGYRLLSAGNNGVLETSVCGASPAGDDVAIPIESVVHLSDRDEALIAGGLPLPPGIYRLLVCAVAAASADPFDGDGDGSPGDAFRTDFRVIGRNWIGDPNFDPLATTPWTFSDDGCGHSYGGDLDGAGTSSALVLHCNDSGGASASECVGIQGPAAATFSGRLDLIGSGDGAASGGFEVVQFAGSGCAGAIVHDDPVPLAAGVFQFSPHPWVNQPWSAPLSIASSTRSAQVILSTQANNFGTFPSSDFTLDGLALDDGARRFDDGFEDGTLFWWVP